MLRDSRRVRTSTVTSKLEKSLTFETLEDRRLLSATVLHEAESTSPVNIDDIVGYDSINWIVGRGPESTASNGELLFVADANSSRRMKVIFAGTGINLIAPQVGDGSAFSWILDEGAQTGWVSTFGTGGPQTSIPIVSGLPNSLHTLEIYHDGVTGGVLRIDAFEILNPGIRTRYEQDSPSIVYSPGDWVTNDTGSDAAAEASGGTVGFSLVNNATATLTFTGESVALTGVARNDASRLHYDIDNGAVTGTIDLAAANAYGLGFWHRWPILLANGLGSGSHTLVLTAEINAGAVNIDAIDVYTPPLLGDLNGDSQVTFDDVAAFAEALTDRPAYDAHGYAVDPDQVGDMDQNGVVDTSDLFNLSDSLAPSTPTYWADSRGLFMFTLDDYQNDWGPANWDIEQWKDWLDIMVDLNLNHLELPRAPWSERPAATQFETDKEDLWISILQEAKNRGMTTSIIFSTTFHGDLVEPWRILSPGNSPADPNWQVLVNDYHYWANRYGQWVDEWVMGVEDPGGSPSSANVNWPFETPSPFGDPSNVSELVSLELEMLAAAQSVNPSSTVVANTWGLQWWGLSSGYSSHLDEFLGNVGRLPAGVPLSTHGDDDAITDSLQATGRDVGAWPFFLIDHEFPVGHTKLHFDWTQSYLQKIEAQGIDDVTAMAAHPIEQLPSLYIYSRLYENSNFDKMALLLEFSSLFVPDSAGQIGMANAISSMGEFWESVGGITFWNHEQLRPIDNYTSTQIAAIDAAYNGMNAVTTVTAAAAPAPQLTTIISAEAWVQSLRDQVKILHDAAHIQDLLDEDANYMNNNYSVVDQLSEPISRNSAETIVNDYLAAGTAPAIKHVEDYLLQFWPSAQGLEQPYGVIYDHHRADIGPGNPVDGYANIAGDFLEFTAPAHGTLYKQLEGITDESASNFSYQDDTNWSLETIASAYGGTVMSTTTSGNKVDILFSGSEISLIHSLWSDGAIANWEIDGGANGSGTIDMFAATRQDQISTQLATGLGDTLHVLSITHSGTGTGTAILVDGVDVTGNNRLRREDTRDNVYYGGSWTKTSEGNASEGEWHYTLGSSEVVVIPFDGTAIAVSAATRADFGVMSWSIDGGAGGSGTIDLFSPYYTFRKPFILSTSLSSGSHTLTLRKESGFLVNIDAIDTVIPNPAPLLTQLDASADFQFRWMW